MPASMIRAPTGGRPKVIGSSIATVAMVPMPGSTPTSVPTSAPTRHSPRLTGVSATLKPRARFEKISITPSRNQEARKELQRQPQRVREQQAAADGQADPDDGGLRPLGLGRAQRGDHEARESGDDEAQRPNGESKGEDCERDEQRPAPVIGLQMSPLANETD